MIWQPFGCFYATKNSSLTTDWVSLFARYTHSDGSCGLIHRSHGARDVTGELFKLWNLQVSLRNFHKNTKFSSHNHKKFPSSSAILNAKCRLNETRESDDERVSWCLFSRLFDVCVELMCIDGLEMHFSLLFSVCWAYTHTRKRASLNKYFLFHMKVEHKQSSKYARSMKGETSLRGICRACANPPKASLSHCFGIFLHSTCFEPAWCIKNSISWLLWGFAFIVDSRPPMQVSFLAVRLDYSWPINLATCDVLHWVYWIALVFLRPLRCVLWAASIDWENVWNDWCYSLIVSRFWGNVAAIINPATHHFWLFNSKYILTQWKVLKASFNLCKSLKAWNSTKNFIKYFRHHPETTLMQAMPHMAREFCMHSCAVYRVDY